MSQMIKLPDERAEQLRTLSKNLGISIAECIGLFINEQIEKGNLEPDVPGFRIIKNDKGYKLKTDIADFRFARQKFLDDAAKAIRAITKPGTDNPLMPSPEGMKLARRGTSIKIIETSSGKQITLAPSVANDVAGMLEREAKS